MNDEPAAARRPLRGLIALLLAFLLLGAAVAGFVAFRKPAPIDVGLRFTPGDTLRFHMVMNVSSVALSGTSPASSEDEIQADVAWRVIAVDRSGTATIVQTLTDQTIRSNGAPVSLSTPAPTTITVGADGMLGSAKGVNLFSEGARGPAQAGIARPVAFLPGHEVRVGDKWTTDVTQPFWGSSLVYRATSSLLRREPLAGVDSAVIETDATVPVDLTVKVADFAGVVALPASVIPKDATATYAGSLDGTTTTSWIDPSNGSLIKTVSRGNFTLQLTLQGFPKSDLTGDGTGTLSGQLSMQLTRL